MALITAICFSVAFYSAYHLIFIWFEIISIIFIGSDSFIY